MRRVLVAAPALLLAACGGTPTVSHLVPAFPARDQSPYVTVRDRAACDQVARTRADGFAYQSACLLAKGYRTYVSVLIGGLGDMQFIVRAEGQPSTDQVLADLTECAREAGGTIEKRSPSATLSTSSGMSSAAQDTMGKPFVACLAPRGYTAERWRP